MQWLHRSIYRSILWTPLLLLFTLSLHAQDPRGTITGLVTNPGGAVVPGAQVTVTNIDTNAVQRTVSNSTGYFEVTRLNPGNYTVAVSLTGFSSVERAGIILSVGSRLEIPFQLQPGQVTQKIVVTAAAPLLDTSTASGGRLIDGRQVLALPVADMNPFTLAALSPGIQWTGTPGFRRPSDVGGSSSFNTAGGVGQAEFTMDGSPITGTDRRVGFVPPSDSVEEFKLETTTFDASYGHTSGATVNVVTKAGTNNFHGSLYDQHYQQRWNAAGHFQRLAFEDAVRRGTKKESDERQGTGRSNFFGATFGGPIRVPKLYNGQDRFFVFVAYNGHYEAAWDADSPNRTVPKMAWRQGDFSDLLAVDANRYTIYDPRSARREGSRVVRTPFPGNKGVPALNPMYSFYEAVYPTPNDVPGLVSADGLNNYLASATNTLKFNSVVNRFDYNLGERHRLFARWLWNHRTPNTRDWAYETAPGLVATGDHRINRGISSTYTWTIGSNSVLDVGASWTRFTEGSYNAVQTSYKPSDVGLPSYLDDKAADLTTLPQVQFANIERLGTSYPGWRARGTTGEARASMASIYGRHSLKYGWNERRYWFTSSGPGNTSGAFTFNNQFMRAADDTNTAANHALDWAAFRMALPSTMFVDTNDSGYWTTPYRAFYVQDDLRVTNRFRLTLGLRYEREGGITERFNRGLSGEFLPDAKLPVSDLVEAAYARNPLPEVPVSQFAVRGGSAYLGQPNKGFTDGTHVLLPRIGAVYQIDSKTVIRGGYGAYADTFNSNNTRPSQYGYSLATTSLVSTDNGLTFLNTGAASGLSANSNPLADPFPVRDGGRFDQPYGNALGVMARAGQTQTYYSRDYRPAYQHRWRIGFQREITSNILLDVSYNGSLAFVPVSQPINYLPQQYWATGNVRNSALDTNLNSNVPNPFYTGNLTSLRTSDPFLYNYLATQSFFSTATTRKNQLLRPFPALSTITGVRPGEDFRDTRGRVRYHDLQLLLERRFFRGLQTAFMYTYTNSDSKDWYANEFDTEPSWQPNNATRPHRLVWSMIYELPFGRNKTWARSGPLQAVFGDWQLSWVYQYQSGPATSWNNVFYYGDQSKIADVLRHDDVNSQDIHAWFDPSIRYTGTGGLDNFQGFEGRSAAQPGQYHVRVFPALLGDLRADGIRGWDVKVQRRFPITERVSASLSVDALNATNHTNFGSPVTDPANPNFGRVTSQNGFGRRIQFNFRLGF